MFLKVPLNVMQDSSRCAGLYAFISYGPTKNELLLVNLEIKVCLKFSWLLTEHVHVHAWTHELTSTRKITYQHNVSQIWDEYRD